MYSRIYYILFFYYLLIIYVLINYFLDKIEFISGTDII